MVDGIPFEAIWIDYHRGELQRLYGAGTFVAVYDNAVIDWGNDRDAVRDRAEKALGEPVFVGAVSAEEDVDFTADFAAANGAWQKYQAAEKGRRYRRRFSMWAAYQQLQDDDLGIIGEKTEYYDGCMRVDGIERRFAEHDYRLLVERGIIPRETVLIAGIVFWREPPAENDLVGSPLAAALQESR